MQIEFYKRTTDTLWTKQGCGCGGRPRVESYAPVKAGMIYNKGLHKIVMTIDGRVYTFLPLKVAFNVALDHVNQVLKYNSNLIIFDKTFAQSTGYEGYLI